MSSSRATARRSNGSDDWLPASPGHGDIGRATPSRCGVYLRVNGVVEDAGEGVVDVAHHVIQLVLSLQPQRVGGLVRVDDHLRVHESWSVKRRRGGSAAGPSRGYLVLRVGVHRSDFQEVEGDLHLRAAHKWLSWDLHATDGRKFKLKRRDQSINGG